MKYEPWTMKEKDILQKNYRRVHKDSLLSMLPGRTWKSIRMMASRMMVRIHHDQDEWKRLITANPGMTSRWYSDEMLCCKHTALKYMRLYR